MLKVCLGGLRVVYPAIYRPDLCNGPWVVNLQLRHHQYTIFGWYNASQEPPAGSKLALQVVAMLPSITTPENAGICPGRCSPVEAPVDDPQMQGLPSQGCKPEVVPGPWGGSLHPDFPRLGRQKSRVMCGAARLARVGPVVPPFR